MPYEFKKNLKQQLRVIDDEEKRKGKKKKKGRVRSGLAQPTRWPKCPSPPAWLIPIPSSVAPLSFSTTHSISTAPQLLPSFSSAPLCSPPSLLPFHIYSRCRPLPDRAYGGEEMAESSGWRQGDGGIKRNRRGDGGIERTSIRIDEEMAESRGRQHAHA